MTKLPIDSCNLACNFDNRINKVLYRLFFCHKMNLLQYFIIC